MQLNFKLLGSLFTIWLFFSSCETDFDPTVEVPAAKPYVTCYLTNTSSQILLYYKTPLLVNEVGDYGNISDALVLIDDGINTNPMQYDPAFKVYRLDTTLTPIRKGHMYSLKIQNSDGTELSAFSTIPLYDPPNIQYSAFQNGSDFQYNFNFTDSSGEEKYFLIHLISMNHCVHIGCNDTDYNVLKVVPIYKKAEQNSVQMNVQFSIGLEITNLGTPYGLTLESFSINKDMYLYYNSVLPNLASNQGSFNQNATPSPVYSNFVAGDGIFGPIMSK